MFENNQLVSISIVVVYALESIFPICTLFHAFMSLITLLKMFKNYK